MPLVTPNLLPARRALPALPAGREPDFCAWMQHAGDRALRDWVKYRLVAPKPHQVYILRLGDPAAVYVGLTADLGRRMREHARAAAIETRGVDGKLVALKLAPGVAWIMAHGLDRIEGGRAVPEAVIPVPDRVVAELVEVLVSCQLAAAGFRVFGASVDSLCHGAAWLPRKIAMWDLNHIAPRGPMANPRPLPAVEPAVRLLEIA
jgi:hypothetical protein